MIQSDNNPQKVDKRHKLDADGWIASGRWVNVKSSNVGSIKYDKDTKKLWVEFDGHGKKDPIYTYDGVPEDVAKGLFNSTSMGKYLHANIKGVYNHTGPL